MKFLTHPTIYGGGIFFCCLLIFSSQLGADGGCNSRSPESTKDREAEKAKRAADSIRFDENAEIENITRRLKLTSAPGLLGYVVLLNGAGQPIRYTTVKGKITSGSKRLTQPYEYVDVWENRSGLMDYHFELVEAPSDEGTYGHSAEYIYFWTQSGSYVQWNGNYLYSDQPIRLSVAPLVIDIQTAPSPTAAPAVVAPVIAPVPVEIAPTLPPSSNG